MDVYKNRELSLKNPRECEIFSVNFLFHFSRSPLIKLSMGISKTSLSNVLPLITGYFLLFSQFEIVCLETYTLYVSSIILFHF